MKMSKPLEQQTSLPWPSSAAAFHAKTSAGQATELAYQVLAAAYGASSSASFQSFARSGWWSKMSPAERISGLTLCAQTWDSSVMQRYRSRLRRRTSARRISEAESSLLLPTLTAKANLLAPSMQKWPAHVALREMLPTLCSRDAKGIGPKHTKGGQDLPRTLGGNLNAEWCRWYMGFPPGYLDVLDASKSDYWETASCRSAPKSSGG